MMSNCCWYNKQYNYNTTEESFVFDKARLHGVLMHPTYSSGTHFKCKRNYSTTILGNVHAILKKNLICCMSELREVA